MRFIKRCCIQVVGAVFATRRDGHYVLPLPCALAAHFFRVGDEWAVDFNAVAVAQHVIERARQAEDAESRLLQIKMREETHHAGTLYRLFERRAFVHGEGDDFLPFRFGVGDFNADGCHRQPRRAL